MRVIHCSYFQNYFPSPAGFLNNFSEGTLFKSLPCFEVALRQRPIILLNSVNHQKKDFSGSRRTGIQKRTLEGNPEKNTHPIRLLTLHRIHCRKHFIHSRSKRHIPRKRNGPRTFIKSIDNCVHSGCKGFSRRNIFPWFSHPKNRGAVVFGTIRNRTLFIRFDCRNNRGIFVRNPARGVFSAFKKPFTQYSGSYPV